MKLPARIVTSAALCALALGIGASRVSADYAVLRNGQRLHITGFERVEQTVRLYVPGGSITVPADDFLSVDREEIVSPVTHPQAAVPPASATAYSEQIRAASLAYALDPLLIEAVIAAESNFNANAVSPKNAQGLMQLLPSTASSLAVRNTFDPRQNIDAGARYLRAMLDRYHNDLVLALAAYNAGPENVDLYHGLPPFRETRIYIGRVLDRWRSRQLSTAHSTPSH